ncbi:heptaprenyl diphosphate synthase component 1 [Oceanobacillus sp. Castelsardo]|uniref:heptaprenyl diphosphate synthase component 1 n=1 Tax=Oceanobacillus sp. Castelsardo TaxID=1851204 RepID=UPI000838720C|nr:heptaprenyl diphosphate synthase component 1 [Oceanobacillus sp. Castelsardo]
MTTSGIDIEFIKKQLKDKLNHSYIKQIIGNPTIDEDKLIFISALINRQSSLSLIEKTQFIITTMLVQIALDTHEQVPVAFHKDMSQEDKEDNQLRVLAGDFYSGQYYYLLAQIDQFDFIQTLSIAIKEINENKMNLYYLDDNLLEESISIVKNIDTLLLSHVAKYFNDSSLNNLASEWLLIKRLIQERDILNANEYSIFISKFVDSNPSFLYQLELLIEQKIVILKQLLETQESYQDKDLVTYVDKQINLSMLNYKTSIVEEG